MNNEVFNLINRISVQSRTYMKQIKKSAIQENKNEFDKALCRYIQCRYVLQQCPTLSDNLYTLASSSIGQAASLPAEVVRQLENESGCTGAKSPMIKKVLLILSLMREITGQLNEDTVSAIDTVQELSDLCWEHKRNDM